MSVELGMTAGAVKRHLRMCKRLLAHPRLTAAQRTRVEQYQAMLLATRRPGKPDWPAIFAFFVKYVLPILLMLLGIL